MVKYDYEFTPNSTYAHALRLLEAHARPEGVVVDLGCGVAPLAHPVADLGWGYHGFELDDELAAEGRERGATVDQLDLRDDEAVRSALTGIGDDVAAVLLLDVLEHLVDPDALLTALRAVVPDDTVLVTSIPNGTHADIARQLLRGSFEYTEAGLLDRTHLRFFSEASAARLHASTGWHQVGEHDRRQSRSEEHVPDSPLAHGNLLGDHLAALGRSMPGAAPITYQFIRAHVPGDAVPATVTATEDDPALSVLVRTRGTRRELLEEALLSLAGQDTDDLEVLVLVHTSDEHTVATTRDVVDRFPASFAARVSVHQVAGGGRSRPGNVGLDVARGRHITFLDDDDVVTADWASTFIDAAAEHPGRVIRAVVADQDGRRHRDGRAPYDLLDSVKVDPARMRFSFVDHLVQSRTPICGFAVPRRAVDEFGLRFDDQREVLEDFEFLMRATSICGVVDTEQVTSVYRRWQGDDATYNATPRATWGQTRAAILADLSRAPVLLPPGSLTEIRALATQASADQQETEQLRRARREWKARAEELQAELRRTSADTADTADELTLLRESRNQWRSRAHELQSEVEPLRVARREWKARAEELQAELRAARTGDAASELAATRARLASIERSRAWRLVNAYRRVARRIRRR